MHLAIVHDYLIQMGGAERVVATMAEAFPDATLYTSVVDRQRLLPPLGERCLRTSWLTWMPGINRHFKKAFLLYPAAFWSLGRLDAKVVWISSSGFSKWTRTGPDSVTVCYCHTPPRFFWESQDYLQLEVNDRLLRALAGLGLSALRRADFDRAQRIDYFIANSRCVQARIWSYYGRYSDVIYPPVDVGRFEVSPDSHDYYVVVARLVGYKRVDRAIEAFNLLGKRLVVIGDGPDRKRLETIAGPTVEFLGRVTDKEVRHFLPDCRGLIFPGREDFGIAPVEAQACGKPVVALRAGGALETVIEGETGVLFSEPTPEGLAQAVESCERLRWDPLRIRRNAERFDRAIFLRQMSAFLSRVSSHHSPEGPLRAGGRACSGTAAEIF
jgi:glycosyltransferase involved in cell wall biosynthesis